MPKGREALKRALRLRAGQLAERINNYSMALRLGRSPRFDTPEEIEQAERDLEEVLAQLKALEAAPPRRQRRRSPRRAMRAHA
jgi:hypothetical protein